MRSTSAPNTSNGGVAAIVGALHGRRGLPERWIDGLGRTTRHDDGRVFEIVDETRRVWGL